MYILYSAIDRRECNLSLATIILIVRLFRSLQFPHEVNSQSVDLIQIWIRTNSFMKYNYSFFIFFRHSEQMIARIIVCIRVNVKVEQ